MLVAALGNELGLSDHDLGIAVQAVHMHDLGMLAADGAALGAPRELSEAERDQLSRWPDAASRLALGAPGYEELAPALAGLGEWWDGSRSPHGLAGAQIPTVSRVLAVALAYVAMSRSRPHRPALAPEEILAELRSLAGTRYEPRVVDALATLVAA